MKKLDKFEKDIKTETYVQYDRNRQKQSNNNGS